MCFNWKTEYRKIKTENLIQEKIKENVGEGFDGCVTKQLFLVGLSVSAA